jgi:hypothetical protein
MLTPPRVEQPDRTMTCGCASLVVYRRLIGLAVGLPVVEAMLLSAFGADGSVALAPQSSAPAPFGVFHDLRWLLVFHPSWLAFALEMVALIAVRSTITALMVRAAWPLGKPAPPPRVLAIGSVAFTVTCSVVLAPFAALLLGMAVVSLSWLFFIAIPAVVAVAALVHHGAVVPTWWRERPPGRTMAWVLLSFVVLTVASACIVLAPPLLRLPVVAAAGLFNAWAWHSIVHTLCCRERSRRFMPVAPLGVAAMLGLIAVGVNTGFSVAARDGGPDPSVAPPLTADAGAPLDGRAVMLVSGFGSSYSGTGDGGRMWETERRYSYAGSAGGLPLAYEATDTYQDVSTSVARMAAQVEAFHADVGRPITIIAESEGALVAKAYLLSHDDAPVDTLVLLSPLVDPGGAYYPPAGDDGWGAAAGLGLRWIAAFASTLSPLEVTSDDGLFRSLADNAPALRGMLACPVDGVDQLAVFPLADAVAGDEPELDGVESTVVPAFHGGLATNADVQRTIHAALEDGDTPDGDWLQTTDRVIRAGTATWRVPTLPISVNPAWENGDDAASCDDIAGLVEAWVG